jgi:hypothetical protein
MDELARRMETIARRMETIEWKWGDKDPEALRELEGRIIEAGRRLRLVTYSELAEGVVFHLPNLRNGAPYSISIHNWTGLDREIIGSFLGYISMRSYLRAGFIASALAVNQSEYKPSEHFFRFMRELNVLSDNDERTILAFWADQVNEAHNWYRRGRR